METSAYFDLISHPDRSLRQHLRECDIISQTVLSGKYCTPDFYCLEKIELWRKWLVYFHDFGKSTAFFQHRIIEAVKDGKNNDEFKHLVGSYIQQFYRDNDRIEIENALFRQSELGRHAKLGAYFMFAHLRDEDDIVNTILFRIILRHHGYLTDFNKIVDEDEELLLDANDENKSELNKQVNRVDFDKYNSILTENGFSEVLVQNWPIIKKQHPNTYTIGKLYKNLGQKKTLDYFLLQHYLFSLLLSADKGDMMLPNTGDRKVYLATKKVIDPKSTWIDNYKHLEIFNDIKEKSVIDERREEAYSNIAKNAKAYSKSSFFSITLPTGLGKTFSAYNAGLILQNAFYEETGSVPRMVYCLPFTSVIDQNADILQKIFLANGSSVDYIGINHYLSTFNSSYSLDTELSLGINYETGEYLTEGWEHDVVVTTFVQFLESIFTNKNKALRKFHNLVHSIVILDEVQSIPPKYFQAVEAVFRAIAKAFGTKFIFVSATQPFLFQENNDIVELSDPTKILTEGYFKNMTRIQLDQRLLSSKGYKPDEWEDTKSVMLQDILDHPQKSFLIICNTINLAKNLYYFLEQELGQGFGNRLEFISSQIIPYHRKPRIQKIKSTKEKLILVSTQVVEAGVDIDFDVVYRDWAPIDSINQSAGRCNRNDKHGTGIVKLFYSKRLKIYDPILLEKTRFVLEKREEIILESEFYEMNLEYAAEVQKAKATNSNESIELIKNMERLDLEKVESGFKLIEEQDFTHNVFLPINAYALKVWNSYGEALKIEDPFERKKQIRLIRPELLKFVSQFPKWDYEPSIADVDKFLLFEPNWSWYYNETTGFISKENQDKVTCI